MNASETDQNGGSIDLRQVPVTAEQLMSVPVVSVGIEATLEEVVAQLVVDHVGAVLVRTGEDIDGLVSERDVVDAVHDGADLSVVWAGDIMTTKLVFVDERDSLQAIAERMLDEGIRHVLVRNDEDDVGIISMRDLLWQFASAADHDAGS